MNHYNCIYMYINKLNGHKYIGQTKDFNKRHRQHINESYNRYPIDRAFNKYGIENFEIIILKENLSTQCLLNFWECYYIEKYDCLSSENYNIASGGFNGYSCAGKTEEEMKEHNRKISEKNKGRKFTEEHKRKLSESRNGEKNPNYGKHFTDEHKRKLSESNKNPSKETRMKISEANKGRKRSEDVKQKMSESRKGKNNGFYNKNHSKEQKEKWSRERRVKVCQYDKQGKLIKIWNGIIEIEKELGIDKASISRCCRGKVKTAGGFIWKYHKK